MWGLSQMTNPCVPVGKLREYEADQIDAANADATNSILNYLREKHDQLQDISIYLDDQGAAATVQQFPFLAEVVERSPHFLAARYAADTLAQIANDAIEGFE